MSVDTLRENALAWLGELHREGRDPVAELAYYRSVERRLLDGKETRLRLR